MAITYSTYEQTWSKLLTYPWDSTDSVVKIQLLSSGYAYDKTHTTISDLDGYALGTAVALLNPAISDTGSISCDDVDFASQGTITATYAVVYVSPGSSTSVSDPLLFHFNLNSGSSIELTDRTKLIIGDLLNWQTATLGLCGAVDDDVVVVDPLTCTQSVGTLAELNTALAAATGGETICYTGATIEPFALENLSYTSKVIVNASNNALIDMTVDTPVIADSGTAGIYVNNCDNLRIHGFEIQSTATSEGASAGVRAKDCTNIDLTSLNIHDIKLYGIYVIDSDYVLVDLCDVDTIGQEAISLIPATASARVGWTVTNNSITSTGVLVAQYGEGIYLGNGSFPGYGPVTGVVVDGNSIDGTTNEAIDIKSSVIEAEITNNTISNVDLGFNGAITICTEGFSTPNAAYTVSGNTVSNVSNRNAGSYFHLAIGAGNVTVTGNNFNGSNTSLEYGIGSYTTAINQNSNDILLGDNKFGNILSTNRYRVNEVSGGTGLSDDLDWSMTSSRDPIFHLDASDSSTLTVVGTAVSEWRDKSGNNWHCTQTVSANRPTTSSRTIGGKNAIEFNGSNSFMDLPNGPLCPFSSMVFVVAVSDTVAADQWIFSGQDNNNTRFAQGINSGATFFFIHGTDFSYASTTAQKNNALISCFRDGTTQYIDAQGVNATNTSGADQRGIDQWFVGAYNGSSNFFNGAIGEIRIYDYYEADKFAEVKQELFSKWAIDSDLYGVSPPVNILEYSPVVWFDASDESTITESSNLISQWGDKSGNGYHLTQATGANQPQTGVDTVNGLNCITAVGEKYMDTAIEHSVLTCIAVFMTDGDASNEYTTLGGATDEDPVADVRWRTTTPQITLDGVGASTGRYSLNGSAWSSFTGNHSASGVIPDVAHVISIEYSASVGFQRALGVSGRANLGKSRLCEVIWLSTSISDSDRSIIEGYLTDKWVP